MTTLHPHFHKFALIIPAFFLVGLLAYYGILPSGNFPQAQSEGWQAVFLENNQTYFGKLSDYNNGYVQLSNVYYLRSGGDLQQGGTDPSQNLSLVKLGGELHGPEDVMYINKDSILFWENLKDTARVVQLIRMQR